MALASTPPLSPLGSRQLLVIFLYAPVEAAMPGDAAGTGAAFPLHDYAAGLFAVLFGCLWL